MAVGSRGNQFKPCIVATADGGRTWTTVYRGPGDRLTAVACGGAQCGWAVGAGTALRTTDGGATWSTMKGFSHTLLMAVAATDTKHVWVGGAGGIWASSDGGVSWRQVWRGNRIYDIDFSDPLHGWAVGSKDPGGAQPGLVLAYGQQ